MQTTYLIAAVIATLTGLIHSVYGEILIFRQLRRGGWIPASAAAPLRERHVRILWATWHLASVFGWAFAALMFRLAFGHPLTTAWIVAAIAFANLGGAILVLVGTKGRHPGWIALGAVAALAAWASTGK